MKPTSSAQHDRQSGPRAERILRAARRLFLAKGYQQTTIRDICRAARLSNGTLYFHFKNKDAIYARIYEECFGFLNDMLARSVRPDMPPLERIETAMKTYLKYFIDHRDMWDMLDISYRRLALPGEIIERFDAQLRTSFSFVQAAVEAHLEAEGLSRRYDSRELALLLFTSIDGIFYDLKQGFFEDSIKSLSLERLVDTQIAIFKTFLTSEEQERKKA
jgi:AcrR family transcriptional regulator